METFTGLVTRWNWRGHGFVTIEGSPTEVFLHYSNSKDGGNIRLGSRVEFNVEHHEKGPQARNVRIVAAPTVRVSYDGISTVPCCFACRRTFGDKTLFVAGENEAGRAAMVESKKKYAEKFAVSSI